MATGRPITAEELLAQSDWVRQLARRIVFDEDGADDVRSCTSPSGSSARS